MHLYRLANKSASRASLASRHSRRSAATSAAAAHNGISYRQQAPMLNDKYFPRDKMMGDLMVPVVSGGNFIHANGGAGAGANIGNGDAGDSGFKYPHLQLRNVCFDSRKGNERVLDSITFEARGGDLLAIMATRRKFGLLRTHLDYVTQPCDVRRMTV